MKCSKRSQKWHFFKKTRLLVQKQMPIPERMSHLTKPDAEGIGWKVLWFKPNRSLFPTNHHNRPGVLNLKISCCWPLYNFSWCYCYTRKCLHHPRCFEMSPWKHRWSRLIRNWHTEWFSFFSDIWIERNLNFSNENKFEFGIQFRVDLSCLNGFELSKFDLHLIWDQHEQMYSSTVKGPDGEKNTRTSLFGIYI